MVDSQKCFCLDFDTEDDLERLIYVYWQWLSQRISKIQTTQSLEKPFNNFGNLIQTLDYDCDTFQVFRQAMKALPEPPISEEELYLALDTSSMDYFLSKMDSEERILFITNNLAKIKKIVENTDANEFSAVCQLAQDFSMLVTEWIERPDKDAHCTQDAFNDYQKAALEVRLNNLMSKTTSENPLSPMSTRIKQVDVCTSLEDRARYLLNQAINQYPEIGQFEHDFTKDALVRLENPPTDFNTISCLHQMVNNGKGISLASCNSKKSQIIESVKVLKQFEMTDKVNILKAEYEKELEIFLPGLSKHYGFEVKSVHDHNNIPDVNIKRILMAMSEQNPETEFDWNISLALLNLLKFFVYSSLGAIDPAERKMLEYLQTIKHSKYVEQQIMVMEKYRDHIGTYHPHLPVLRKALQELEAQIETLVCR